MDDNPNPPRPTGTSSASESAHDSTSSLPSPAAPISSLRSPVGRARPRLPAGPRTRKTTTLGPSKEDHNEDHTHTPPLTNPPAWTAGVQLTNPFSSTPVPLLSNQPDTQPPPAPHAPHKSSASSTPPPTHQHLDDHNDTRPGTPTPVAPFSSVGTASRKPSHATVYSTPPLALPAAQLNLTPEPLPYKHLTLDAAHWTLTSTELQSLVSSAIRDSAKEQFIRLLPLSAIDGNIPEDVARIDRSWDAAAARWRFEAHRRNMLLRALAASGADIDLLSQLSGTLGTLDSHAQDLLHAAAHRTQISAARDTHRASALAVALRKLNASYARRTRDLDKARTTINALRSEVEEAWKVAEEQAAEVDRLKSEANATAQLEDITDTSGTAEPATDDDITIEDELPDGASIHLISRAQVVDVTGTAIAAQARLTMMPSPGRSPPIGSSSNNSTPRITAPPPSASPTTLASDTPLPSSASQVSRVSAARRRSTRKSKASLRLPSSFAYSTGAVARSRSRSVLRGEASIVRRATRSKSRSKKGKERDASLPWLADDIAGSFLEMEGRPAGDEDVVDAADDGEVEVDADEIGDGDDEGSAAPSRTDATDVAPPPHSAPATSSTPQMQPPTDTLSESASTLGITVSSYTPEHYNSPRRSSDSTPSSPAVPSISIPSTPTFPASSDSHHHRIPDPASIFANATTTSLSTSTATSTTPTTAASTSALDIARRGHSLDLPSSTASTGKHHRHATGAKIRRSFSQLLNFGSNGARSRRRSLPFTFKGRSSRTAAPVPGTTADNGSSRSGVGSSPLQHSLNLRDVGAEGSEEGWEEDTREDDGASSRATGA